MMVRTFGVQAKFTEGSERRTRRMPCAPGEPAARSRDGPGRGGGAGDAGCTGDAPGARDAPRRAGTGGVVIGRGGEPGGGPGERAAESATEGHRGARRVRGARRAAATASRSRPGPGGRAGAPAAREVGLFRLPVNGSEAAAGRPRAGPGQHGARPRGSDPPAAGGRERGTGSGRVWAASPEPGAGARGPKRRGRRRGAEVPGSKRGARSAGAQAESGGAVSSSAEVTSG